MGGLIFLAFLKPIINGTGHYFVEPETRNSTRMDIVVTYAGEQFIIETKIWHGAQYRADGIKQLSEYMENRQCDNGYLVSFSFNRNKEYTCGFVGEDETDKRIFEVVV